jgi:hypothetical protein
MTGHMTGHMTGGDRFWDDGPLHGSGLHDRLWHVAADEPLSGSRLLRTDGDLPGYACHRTLQQLALRFTDPVQHDYKVIRGI